MARAIFQSFLAQEQSRALCAVLDRHGETKPQEQYAETFVGIDDPQMTDPGGALDLGSVVALQQVRALLQRATRDFAKNGGLVTDYTLFKRGGTGHRKGPHHDAGNPAHAQRVFTALLYLNDCDSGAVAFGPWRTPLPGSPLAGQPGTGLEVRERVLPAAGRLVLFDDAPDNAHLVEAFHGPYRYSVMSWFCVPRSGRVTLDWVASYLAARRDACLLLAASDVTVEAMGQGTLRLTGKTRDTSFAVRLREGHRRWLERVIACPEFRLRELFDTAPDLPSRGRALELICALAKASAVVQAGGA